MKLKVSSYEAYKEKIELNLLERELRTQAEVDKQVRNNEANEDVELVESDVRIKMIEEIKILLD